jgi:hypothetical protein
VGHVAHRRPGHAHAGVHAASPARRCHDSIAADSRVPQLRQPEPHHQLAVAARADAKAGHPSRMSRCQSA